MIRFVDVLKAEILKTKRTWNFSLVLFLPIVVTIIIFGYHLKEMLGAENVGGGSNVWISYSRVFFQFYYLLYPLLAALTAFSLSNIEHKNNGFKQIFTFPINKITIYFGKVFILLFWLFCSLLLAYSLLMLSGNLLGYLFPEAGFQNYDINLVIMTFFVRTFITLISIVSIHFFLSMYWNNFIVSVGSACFLVIFGLVISKWEYSYLIPYCNLLKAFEHFFKAGTEIFTKEILWSIGYSIIFFFGGYFIMLKKSIK